MKKLLIIGLIVLLFTGLFVGCASSKNEAAYDSATSSGYAEPQMMVTEEAAEAPAMDFEEEARAKGGDDGVSSDFDTGTVDLETDRKLIYQAYYSIETTDFDEDYAFILSTLESTGGYAQNTSVDGTKPTEVGDWGRFANLSLRVPVDQYDRFLTALEGVGSITSKSQNADDVSAQYFDTEARIRILNTQLDRLEALMAKAQDIEDIIILEQEISDVMYELDRYEGQKRQLDNLIDYTTVSIYLQEVNEISTISASDKGVGQRIKDGFVDVIDVLVRFFEVLLIIVVAGSPVWITIGVIVVLVVWLTRRHKRKKAEKETKTQKK